MINKEYDPFMHSAEHILNGTMVKTFNIDRSFSQHIEKKKSKCDYHFDRNLTEEEIKNIENKINAVINEGLDVTEEFISRTSAAELYNLDKLPDQTEENIRIVKIGDYDACPCIGPHVKNTSEIGKIKIISTGFEDGILRIRFKREIN